jgi:hypothetical protein
MASLKCETIKPPWTKPPAIGAAGPYLSARCSMWTWNTGPPTVRPPAPFSTISTAAMGLSVLA